MIKKKKWFHSYLEVWVEAEQEGLSCTVAVFTDFEWIGRKSPENLKIQRHRVSKGFHSEYC